MLGGKIDMPAINMAGEPLEVTGRVKLISEGRFRNLGPASTGVEMNLGPTVVLDTGRVEIVVISRHHEPKRPQLFLEPRDRPGHAGLSHAQEPDPLTGPASPTLPGDVIECAGTGVCTSDYDMLDFRNVRRPIYPLDRINEP